MLEIFKTVKAASVVTMLSIGLTACATELEKEHPIATGNTIDEWGQLDKAAPVYSNVNISYEFDYIYTLLEEETGREFWIYKGRIEDRLNRYLQLSYVPEIEGEIIPPGQVITQGRLRVTSFDTCVPASLEMSERQNKLFGESLASMKRLVGVSGTDMFIRRFISNMTEDGSRRLEAVYFISLDDVGLKCSDVTGDNASNEDVKEMLSDWKDDALRAFEIIG